MQYENLHEKEVISLVSDSPRKLSILFDCLRSAGFVLHEDVFCVDRNGNVPPWQHDAVAEVKIYRGEDETYEKAGFWDRVDLEYLYAFLPPECQGKFIDAAEKVSVCLGLPMRHRGLEVNRTQIVCLFEGFAKDLMDLGEVAGSETLAIYIQDTYPR